MRLRSRSARGCPIATIAVIGASLLSSAPARAANCKSPEVATSDAADPNKSYCCPADTRFVSGDCVSADAKPAPAAAVTEEATAGAKAGGPRSWAISIVPVLTCSDVGNCKAARISVDGEAKLAESGTKVDFTPHRDTVRVDVQADGYEDFTTHLPVVPGEVLTLRAPLRRLRNFFVRVDPGADLDVDENVYVERHGLQVASCAIKVSRRAVARGVVPECSMTVHLDADENEVCLRLSGIVNFSPPDKIAVQPAGNTVATVTLRKATASPWNLVVPILFTLATAGVIVAGTKTGDTAGDVLLTVGGGLTAVDLIGGGLLLANWFAPSTGADLRVDGKTPTSGSAIVATRAAPASVTAAFGPGGLIVRW